MKRAIVIVVLSLVATILSGEACQRLGDELIAYPGVEPGMSYTRVVVGGWPLPYLYDSVAVSPVGSVSHIGALLGIDHWRVLPFVADVAMYALALVILWRIARLRRSSARRLREQASRGRGVTDRSVPPPE